MCEKTATFGLKLSPLILDIFEFLDKTDAVIESRYIRTGFKRGLEISALLATVEAIRATVKKQHEIAGIALAATHALP
jgi:hypothetical protein